MQHAGHHYNNHDSSIKNCIQWTVIIDTTFPCDKSDRRRDIFFNDHVFFLDFEFFLDARDRIKEKRRENLRKL